MKIFKSKKFLVALGSAVAVAISELTGIAQESVMPIIGLAIGYILSQGLADFGKEKK